MSGQLTGLRSVLRREFNGYFSTPMGYIFLVIFLLASGYLMVARDYGAFIEMRQASMASFFRFIPWIYVVLVPAVAMRLWAEERKTGTIELLFTLPITLRGSYLGKFLAGWGFLLVGLALTFPVIIQVARLGSPDWGVIFVGYLGCALIAGVFLAIGMFFSAATKNQVVAFILGVTASVIFLVIGLPQSLEVIGNLWLVGGYLEQVVSAMSLADHFGTLTRGLLSFRAVFFFIIMTLGWLASGILLLDRAKAS